MNAPPVKPKPPIDELAWIFPAVSALVSAVMIVLVPVAWWSLREVGSRLDLREGTRRFLTIGMAAVEIFVIARTWWMARRALGYWRRRR